MRFTDRIKQFGSMHKLLTGILTNVNESIVYIEDYMINQNSELIIIGSISYKQITYPVIIDMRDINGNET